MINSRNLVILTYVLMLSTFIGNSQGKSLKIVLLYDMEGVTGVTDVNQICFRHRKEYEQARKSLTADVNAAIAGLKAGGATEIVVVDGHGSGNSTCPDVLVEQLMAPAKMLYRDSSFDIYMDSYDRSVDAVVAIGMHAGVGNRAGFLSHTCSAEDVEYKVNGVPFNESMILAAGAARLRIPLIMVSGGDQLEKGIKRTMPWVRFASVKHAVNRAKAEPVKRAEASRRIEAAARDAIENLATAALPNWPGPYRFSLKFQDERQARMAALVPGTEVLNGGFNVQIRANDFEEGYLLSRRQISLASIIGWSDAMQAVIKAQKNAEELETSVVDWWFDRALNRLPIPPAHTVSEPVQRPFYWGAK